MLPGFFLRSGTKGVGTDVPKLVSLWIFSPSQEAVTCVFGCKDTLRGPQQERAKEILGGDERIRTADPHVANVVLSQLSYIPIYVIFYIAVFPKTQGLHLMIRTFQEQNAKNRMLDRRSYFVLSSKKEIG